MLRVIRVKKGHASLRMVVGIGLWAGIAYGQQSPIPEATHWDQVRDRLQTLSERAELVPAMLPSPSDADRWRGSLSMSDEPRLDQSQDPSTRARGVEWSDLTEGGADPLPLINRLMDPDVGVRQSAAEAILRLDPDALADTLLRVGVDPEYTAAFAGLEPIFPQLRDRIETPLMMVLSSPAYPPDQRSVAARLLGDMHSQAAAALFADVIWAGSDTGLAVACAEALADLSFAGALPGLLELTDHAEPEIRWNAARGLGLIGGDRAAQALETIASGSAEPDIEVRLAALESLSVAGRPESVPALAHAMTLNPVLRDAAGAALRKLTGVSIPNDPEAWLKWHQSGVWTDPGPQMDVEVATDEASPPMQESAPGTPVMPPFFQPGNINQEEQP